MAIVNKLELVEHIAAATDTSKAAAAAALPGQAWLRLRGFVVAMLRSIIVAGPSTGSGQAAAGSSDTAASAVSIRNVIVSCR